LYSAINSITYPITR